MNSFYTEEELKSLPIKSFGKNVLISKKVSFYSDKEITIGHDVRIDDFCILSGSIHLGNYIHIGAYCALYGSHGIKIEDFSGLSPRCTIFSASDDFNGNYLISPTTQKKHNHIITGEVIIKKYSQVGASSTIMPNTVLQEGTAVGAMSLITKSTLQWSVYVGTPAKKIKNREKGLLNFIHEYE
ncbi:galactoside O-acetyltransferase [Chryseobacterium aquaticum]|jgi:galactoside O-acetyltransferase|uniref:Galactoside O-acetyltransferase n=1 Tax=Chryseobacterium aquaticum TaxID=452084 RepID=A0A0Q3HWR0_9FLAO|nr:acyltransferase [Chryseobacterium aquaticum]KQK27295.1 galactoside O-acetyltransferase [Chryseobacterium aquaticum]